MPPSPLKTSPDARQKAHASGHRAETLAAWLLRAKFYRIVAKRYKTPVGEIDLIAERFGVTVFVEVKARASHGLEGEALQAVNRQRIVRAAQSWLSKHPEKAATPLRFDVIFLAPRRWPRHVINAFDAS